MNDKNDINKIVLASLASLLLGSLFFASGISIDSSFLPSIVNYVIAMLMFIASFLAVKRNIFVLRPHGYLLSDLVWGFPTLLY